MCDLSTDELRHRVKVSALKVEVAKLREIAGDRMDHGFKDFRAEFATMTASIFFIHATHFITPPVTLLYVFHNAI